MPELIDEPTETQSPKIEALLADAPISAAETPVSTTAHRGIFSRIADRLPINAFLQRSVWGIGDQGLISANNFITMVLVARSISPAAFGAFALVYSAILLLNILQHTLITWPHNVLGTAPGTAGYRRYTTSVAAGQLGLSLVLSALLAGAAAICQVRGLSAATLLWAAVPALFFWQCQEFTRRVLYTELRPSAAFFNDVIAYGLQGAGVAFFWWNNQLTGALALVILAATSAAATVIGLAQIRSSLGGGFDLGAWRKSWKFGKYLAGAELIGWCSSLPIYLFVAAILLGSAAAAQMKISQVMFGPTRVIAYFLATVLPTQFARSLTDHGKHALRAQLRKTLLIVAPILIGYCMLVAIFPTFILQHTAGRQYIHSGDILSLYAVEAVIGYAQMLLAAALSAQQRTHQIFLGNLWGGLLSLTISWPFIYYWGITGALAAMILANAFVLFFFATACAKFFRDDTAAPQVSAAGEMIHAS